MSRNAIKYLAMVTMFCNHFAYVFLKEGSIAQEVMIDIGYFTAITMCYFLVEGYHYTKSVKKYAMRLLVFGVLSQLPFMLALKETNLNMMFSLLLCLGVIWTIDHVKNAGERKILLCILIFCSLWTDWALLAPVFTILFTYAYGDKKKVALAYAKGTGIFLALNILSYMKDYCWYQAVVHAVCACIGLVISGMIIQYGYDRDTKRTVYRWGKWFFYGFYPAHLFVLWLMQFVKVYIGR